LKTDNSTEKFNFFFFFFKPGL